MKLATYTKIQEEIQRLGQLQMGYYSDLVVKAGDSLTSLFCLEKNPDAKACFSCCPLFFPHFLWDQNGVWVLLSRSWMKIISILQKSNGMPGYALVDICRVGRGISWPRYYISTALCINFVFFTSKFLRFFGPSLSCPCNGLFGSPDGNYSMQRFLVDYLEESVSSVQQPVKSKFSFDSIWLRNHDYLLNLMLTRDRDKNCVSGLLEMEGELSCSLMSGANVGERDLVLRNESATGIDAGNELVHVKEERFDIKGKGIVNQRPCNCLRRRWKVCADFAKVSPVLSFKHQSYW